MKTYIKLVPALLAATLTFTMTGPVSSANQDRIVEKQAEETDRVMVKMEKQDATALRAADISVLESVEDGGVVTVEVPSGKSLASFVEEVKKIEGVESVEPDHLIKLDYVPNDPYVSIQYHHDRIGTEKAWNLTKGSSDVLIAVIDGGFDVNHSELVDQISYAYSTVTDSSTGVRIGEHGTHVAGIIGSSMDNNRFGTGVAPNTDLLLIDVFGPSSAYTSDVIEGIYLAVDAGADIINMSLGNYNYSYNLDKAVQYAHANGAVIVAASGNDDTDLSHYPSSLDNVIAVGATDSYDDITDYSNYGNDQDLVAPGTDIYSTLPYEQFDKMTGTSMAAPVVSGVAALILANEPYLTNVEIEERLFSTAEDLWMPGKDIFFGHGLVNAEAALMANENPVKSERISGSNRYTTAVEISKRGWRSSDQVVLATAADFPDALAGGPLAYQNDAPILLTRSASLSAETRAEIIRLGAGKVIILGSKNAVSLEVEAELVRMNLSVERIGGKNRFDTAAMIAERLESTEAVIANGLNFPDVLSVSSYAARNGIPILLTRKDSLPAETASALQEVSNTFVIGSTGVVGQSVYNQLPLPERFGGSTRYDTSYEVMMGLPMGNEKAYVATGQNYPDALAGSVLAAKNNAPILLVKADSIPAATRVQLPRYRSFSIFGGIGAVSDNVRGILDWELKN